MNLTRIHAYEVTPQRLAKTVTPPRGGALSADAAFQKSLNEFFRKSRLKVQPTVDFRVQSKADDDTSHDVRKSLIDYCFGAASTAKKAALALAGRLGKAMDDRSPFTLLLLAAYEDGTTRRLIIWAFPKDEPFHFSASGDRAKVRILKDAFSRSSSFRKAAMYEGRNKPMEFQSGRVIDRQAQQSFGTAADYWVSNFLDSRFSLTGKAGTRLLARTLRSTYDLLTDQNDKDQISNAIVAVHASKRRQWSLRSFANEYFEDDVKKAFLSKAPPESRTTTFSFQKQEFEQKLNFRIFRLEDDVMVSAPFGTIGQSVHIEDGEERTLTCEGVIVDEKVRARYA